MNDKLKPNYSGFFIPVAIIFGAALIIFGITKMLNSQSGYKRLIGDLNSKTFGNRWVAAYELSKYLSTKSIPEEDIPWVIENLSQVYEESIEPRTRNFIILALGSMRYPGVIETLNTAMRDDDDKVQFNAIVALSNLKRNQKIDYAEIEKKLKGRDLGLIQISMLTLATHGQVKSIDSIKPFIHNPEIGLKVTAATSLLSLNDLSGLSEIENLFGNKKDLDRFNPIELEQLQLNVLAAIEKMSIPEPRLIKLFRSVSNDNSNPSIAIKAKQALLRLENL